MKVRGIVFDLDGTLLDTLSDIADSFNYALRLHGLPEHPTLKYKEFVGSGAKVLAQRAVGISNEALTAAVLQDYRTYYALHSADKTAPYAGIPEMLSALAQNYKIAVLSNKPHSDVVPLIKHFFPHIPFCAVYGQRDGAPRKPDPTVALTAAAQMDLTANETAFCGDSENDILTANNAHMPAIAVLWGFRSRDQLRGAGRCAFYCKTPADVVAALEDMNGAE